MDLHSRLMSAGAAALVIGLPACRRHVAVIGDLDVIVDSTLTSHGSMRVGTNPDAPNPGDTTTVRATREPDGAILIHVSTKRMSASVIQGRTISGTYQFGSQVRLRETQTGLRASASAGSEELTASWHPKWPFETMRGSARVNHARWNDLAGSPLVVRSELTGFCAGSDVTLTCQVLVTQADLR